MADRVATGVWPTRLSWLALILAFGAVAAALTGALGTGQGLWPFRTGFTFLRYALFAAAAGAVLALAAMIAERRSRRRGLMGRNIAALAIAGAFLGYLGSQIATARSVPAIHDISTDLDDLPEFRALPVRADNLENMPGEDDPELAGMSPEQRWKALHRRAYGDLKPISVPWSVTETLQKARVVAEKNGWEIAHVDPQRGQIEATDTSFFFRFKDDVVIRARPHPEQEGRTLVDMRSISRVGLSDVGVNAKRIREFLKDLRQS